MPHVPAQCPNPKCQAIFPSGFIVSNVTETVLLDNKSQCPYCGTLSPVAEGILSASADAIYVISGSNFTRHIIEQFQSVAQDVASGNISKNDAVVRAEKIDPRLASLLSRYFDFGISGVALLVAIVSVYLADAASKQAHGDALAQRAISERILEKVMQSRHFSKIVESPQAQRLPGLGGAPYQPTKK